MEKLPNNWVKTDLDTVIIRMTNGSGLRQEELSFEGSLPISRIETIWNETIDLDRVKYVSASDDDIKKYALQKGDVLFSHINSDKHLGKTAVFNLDKTVIHGINLLLLRAIPQFNGDLLNYILRHYRFSGKFIEVAQRSVNQSSINQKKLKSFTVPLPPLAEQQRIVAKLDGLFGHLDSLKQRLKHIPTLLKQFRQSVLTQAVTGKLTEEWRVGKNLGEWSNLKMGDIVNSIDAGKSFKCPEYPVEKGQVGLVKISAVTWNVFNPTETKTVTDKSRINEKYFINSGDFLISRANTLELIGASVLVDDIEFDIMLSDKVWRVNFINDTAKLYAHKFLKSSQGRIEIESRATGNQLSMRNLSQNNFKDIDIPMPPLKEQTEIVKQVEALFDKAETIEAAYDKLKKQIDSLPQAILAKAFKGELVEQLPTDGDAKELLKEITALRAFLEKEKKSKKKKKQNN
jgi:type I restriction enzyme, S subunit